MAEPTTLSAGEVLDVPLEVRPRHIAIIMDGNGRWAQRQGLPRIEGHRRGVASVRRTTEECARLDIEQLTLYCLSSENWKRPQRELEFLMHLLEQYMIEERSTIMEQNIRVDVIGRRDDIPDAVQREMDKTIDMSRSQQRAAAVPGDQLRRPRRRWSTRFAGWPPKWPPANSARRRSTEETIGRALIHRRHARSRPADSHGRRNADQQLPAVADQLRRDLGHRCTAGPSSAKRDLHQAIRDFATRDRRFGGLNR